MDKIIVKDLLVRGIVGINPEERVKKQDILVNLTVFADIGPAAASDQIEDAVNYRSLTKRIIEYVEESSHFLVETLVMELARLIFREFDVERVRLRVEKPTALRFADSVGVEIERSRRDFPAG